MAKVEEYQQGKQQRLGASVLKLRNGQCLNFEKLKPPWQLVEPDVRDPQLRIAAPANAVGIRPDGRGSMMFAGGDGMLRIYVTGWSPSADPDIQSFVWTVASPARIDQNIDNGLFKRIDRWSGNSLGLEAYSAPGLAFVYVDSRRYSQCRDYNSAGLIRCSIVSEDGSWSLSADLSTEEREHLPSSIEQMLRVVQSTFGDCPNGK